MLLKIFVFWRFPVKMLIITCFIPNLCVCGRGDFLVTINFVHLIMRKQVYNTACDFLTFLFCVCFKDTTQCPLSCFEDCLKFIFLNSCGNNALRISTFYIKHVSNSLKKKVLVMKFYW